MPAIAPATEAGEDFEETLRQPIAGLGSVMVGTSLFLVLRGANTDTLKVRFMLNIRGQPGVQTLLFYLIARRRATGGRFLIHLVDGNGYANGVRRRRHMGSPDAVEKVAPRDGPHSLLGCIGEEHRVLIG